MAAQRGSSLVRRRRRAGLVIVLPALAVVTAVLWLPVAQGGYYGFTDWNGITAQWIGLANYRAFVASPEFREVIVNNLLLLTVLPVLVFGPLAIALILSRVGRGRSLFRTLMFVPVPLSWTVIGIAGGYVFADKGPFNGALGAVGLGGLVTDWAGHGTSAMISLLMLITWALFGVNLLIYQSGVSSLDETVIDAAKVDGATSLRIFTAIIVPMLRPFVRFVAIYTTTLIYGALFAMIYVFTGGGPGYSTTTLEFFTYYQGFDTGQFAAAAASGTLLFLVIFLVNLPQLRRFLRSR